MKLIILLGFFIFSSLALSAQCFNYQSELQNVESFITTAIKELKKAEKAKNMETAQKYIDKAVSQVEFAEKSANLANEYAIECHCKEGKDSATLIKTAAFDCRTQAHNAAELEKLDDLKKLVGKSLTAGSSVLEEVSNGLSYCLE